MDDKANSGNPKLKFISYNIAYVIIFIAQIYSHPRRVSFGKDFWELRMFLSIVILPAILIILNYRHYNNVLANLIVTCSLVLSIPFLAEIFSTENMHAETFSLVKDLVFINLFTVAIVCLVINYLSKESFLDEKRILNIKERKIRFYGIIFLFFTFWLLYYFLEKNHIQIVNYFTHKA